MRFREFAQLNPKVWATRGETYPFIEMSAIDPGQRYVTTVETREYTGGGAKFEHGDTLFARITPCLENGKIAQYIGVPGNAAFGSTEFFVFRAKPGICDPGFLYYLSC